MSNDKKAIIHEIEVDDLVALALGDSSTEDVMEKLSQASRFIYECGIKNGTTKVSAQLIYFTYKQWKIKGKHQPKSLFFRDFSKYFPKHRDQDGPYYLLNEKPFDFTESTKWLIRKLNRDEKARKKTKQPRKAKTNKVSGSQ